MKRYAVTLLVELADDTAEEIGTIVVWNKTGGYPLTVRLIDIHPDPSAIFTPEQLAGAGVIVCRHCGRDIERFDGEWKDAGTPSAWRIVRCYDEADTIPTDVPSDQRHQPAS